MLRFVPWPELCELAEAILSGNEDRAATAAKVAAAKAAIRTPYMGRGL